MLVNTNPNSSNIFDEPSDKKTTALVSFNQAIVGLPKGISREKKLLDGQWRNAEIELYELRDVIKKGHPYGPWQTRRILDIRGVKRRYFVKTGVLTINVPCKVQHDQATWEFLDETAFCSTPAVPKEQFDPPSKNIVFVLEEPIDSLEIADQVTSALCVMLDGKPSRSTADLRVWGVRNNNDIIDFQGQHLSVDAVNIILNRKSLQAEAAVYVAQEKRQLAALASRWGS